MEETVAVSGGAELSDAQKQLTDLELRVLKALLDGKSHTAAGEEVGRCRRTVQYWIQKPTFREALREGREALLKEASTLLHANGSWAVEQLREMVLDKQIGGYARVVAARALIELMRKTAVADEQSEQIAAIRAELAAIRKAAAGETEEAEGEG